MNPKTLLLVSTAIAGALFAGMANAQSANATTSANPTQRLGASGAPVIQNAAPNSAAAQQSAVTGANSSINAAASNSSQDTVISEIIVTAEKRSQNLQQVPVAISAFTAEKRDLLGIVSVVDQTNYTPGLTYTPGNDRLSLRGVGRLTNTHSADSGTAIYVDGAFVTSATQASRSPLFVERTEVLRGPQGTLYGRNAIGGTLNLISKRPTREFTAEARLGFGNYDTQRFDATVSGPLTENLRARFNFSRSRQGEGFENNLGPNFSTEAGNRNETYYEAQLEGEVGKADFWFDFYKNIWNDSGAPGLTAGGSFAPSDTGVGTGAFPSSSYCFGGAINCVYRGPAGNPVLTTGDRRAETHDTQFNNTLHGNEGTVFHATYHFPTFDLKYVGGFNRYNYFYKADNDNSAVQSYQVPLNTAAVGAGGVPLAVVGGRPLTCAQLVAFGACAPGTVNVAGAYTTYQEDEEFYSHDVTIASTWAGPLQYIAGVYFYHEKAANPIAAYAPNQAQLAAPITLAGTAGVANPSRRFAYTNDYISISSKAVYGQVDYKITDTIKLTGGLRYTQDDKKAVEEERFVYFGTNAVAPYTLANYGINTPAIDVTASAIGTATAAQLAAQGGTQQGVIGGAYYDPTTGYWKRNLRDGSNAATGTAGVEWTPDRRTLAYFKYSRGYKAFGLFAAALPNSFSAFPFSAPEQMDNFEVGLKKDWTRRFQTNITAFYDMYYDAQVPLSVQQGNAPAFSLFYNVPRSVLQGVELESTWAPIDRLNILFTYAYLDAHVTKGCCVSDPNDPTATAAGAQPAGASSQGSIDAITGLPTRGQDLKGQALPFSPKNKVAINVNYTYPLANLGDLIGSVSYLWRDEQYSSFFNREYNRAPARDQVDLRLTFKDAKNRFNLIGYARNVFDKDSFEAKSGTRTSTGAVYSSYTLVEPRTFGAEIQVRF